MFMDRFIVGKCKEEHGEGPGVLLVDLHGHGHPHDYIGAHQ
jgi:hypothetical protein